MNQERFIELVTKEFIGEINSVELEELSLLLSSSASHRRKYEDLRSYLFENQETPQRNINQFQKITERITEKDPSFIVPKRNSRHTYWLKAVAVILLVASASLITHHYFDHESLSKTEFHVIKTPHGDKKQVTLSDGTKVVLNAGSKLVYPESFNGEKREVSLIGEAYFDVHHDTEHPFLIHTGKMDIKVLGTAFNVKSYPDDNFTETTLIRGKVQVTMKDRPADVITLKPSEKLIVRFAKQPEGHSGIITGGLNPLTEVTYLQHSDSLIVETSWINNKIIFKDESFGDLAKRLERAYNVDIQFKDDKVKNFVFSGTFGQESIRDILDALRLTEHFTYTIEEKRITIQ